MGTLIKQKVLFIDDEQKLCHMFKRFFTQEGYDVTIAINGEEGLDQLKKDLYSLVIVDMKMPGIDGLRVVEYVKRHHQDIEVVLLTGYGSIESAVEALRKGACDFVQKPFDFSFMRAVMDRALERARLNKETKRIENELARAQRLKALGEMASGVAHDFNNVLGGILGYVQLLKNQASNRDTLEKLEMIEKVAIDGTKIIRRIEEFVKVQPTRVFTPVDVNSAVNGALDITRPKWKTDTETKENKIKVIKKLEKIPKVMGDEGELKEVFTNVIINAVESMEEGGTLSISTRKDGDFIKVDVTDTGAGITEEVKERVFDPFFTTKYPHGSGLGLSVAYVIVMRHGGKIEVNGSPGKGTSVCVSLPLQGQEDKIRKNQRQTVQFQRRKANILIVDDDDVIRKLLVSAFESAGHKVSYTKDSVEAKRMVSSEIFDIVFTDLSLPEVTGFDLGRYIKQVSPLTAVALMSGWGTALDERKVKSSGIDVVLTKPFDDVNWLLDLIDEAILKKEK